MRKLEIQAYSVEHAKLQAYNQGITVLADASVWWRKKGRPTLTKDLKMFAAEYMESKGMFDFEGTGIIIAIIPGRTDERMNPYKLTKHKRQGRCKTEKVIEIRRKSDNVVVGMAPNKMEAYKLAKKVIKKQKTDLYAKTAYISQDIDFEMEYLPSTHTRLGQYVVFGVDDGDVKHSKNRNRGGNF